MLIYAKKGCKENFNVRPEGNRDLINEIYDNCRAGSGWSVAGWIY
jgi:hypothetical protein